jgi:release factor glutamine methyltransferase
VKSLPEVKLNALGIELESIPLEMAKRNHHLLKYHFSPYNHAHLGWIQGDRLSNVAGENVAHVIVSNPPYIMKNFNRDTVHSSASRFDPERALYLDDEIYFQWFDLFFKQVMKVLQSQGHFLMEGHVDHWSQIQDMVKDAGFINIEIIDDLTERPRFLRAQKP